MSILTEADRKDEIRYLCKLIDKYLSIEEKLDIVSFIEQNRVLPQGIGRVAGAYRFSKTPYLREIIECFNSNSIIQEVTVMKGAQIGATVGLLENLILYIIGVSPAPTLFLANTADVAENIFETRVDPAIDNTGLRHLISSQIQRKNNKATGDTKNKKTFHGGFVQVAGLNSISKLKSFSIKYLLVTEADESKSDLAGQGDPISLAERRLDSYSSVKKIFIESTPTNSGSSVIEDRFLQGDQRYYYVPCKHCGELQKLEFQNLKWELDDSNKVVSGSVYYQCKFCEGKWKNIDKEDFLKDASYNGRAKWIPSVDNAYKQKRSYHISSLYSPVGFRSWEEIIKQYVEAMELEKNGDKSKIKVFYNQALGLTYKESEQSPPYEIIFQNNRGPYLSEYINDRGDLMPTTLDFDILKYPPLFCTMASDIQKNYIEVGVVLWALGMRSFTIGYHRLYGDTSDIHSKAWRQLEYLIKSKHAGMYASIVFVDYGYNASLVFDFCERIHHQSFRGDIVFPIKGVSTGKLFKVSTESIKAPPLININVNQSKLEVYSRVVVNKTDDDSPPLFCNFPSNFTIDYFKMLVSEERRKKHSSNGKDNWEWHLPKGRRNEALDIMGYNIVAAYLFCDDFRDCKKSDGSIDWDLIWEYLSEDTWVAFREQYPFDS